jgi:hypothetical protein
VPVAANELLRKSRIFLTQAKTLTRNSADTAAVIATTSYPPEPLARELAGEQGLNAAVGMTYGVLLGSLFWGGLLLWLGH